MTDTASPGGQFQLPHIDLKVGAPYANLIAHQQIFADAVGQHFRIDPACIVPMAGAMGAIDAIRNHVMRMSKKETPIAYMLSPDYWRARESFLGLGFQIMESSTQQHDFFIDEQTLAREVEAIAADLLYVSLPNNPTGATFNPEAMVKDISERTCIIIDMTLPCAELDPKEIVPRLHRHFADRSNLFLVGSPSKSHGVAQWRIGWAICSNASEAEILRKENRSGICTFSIQECIKCLGQKAPAIETIACSFDVLREGERYHHYEIVRPPRMVETGYVLIKVLVDIDTLRTALQKEKIAVMWGTEVGLPDAYIRLETIDTANVQIFVDAINQLS